MSGSIVLKTTDPRSLFYLHASDNPGALLTTVRLLGEKNYETWVKAMMNSLKAKNKLGFIDGMITSPSDSASDTAYCWITVNSMVSGWIHNTIDPGLQPYIPYFDMAKALWDDLKERYSVANDARLYQLKAEIANLKAEGLTVSEYYARLKGMWDDVSTADPIPECSNDANFPIRLHLMKALELDQVYQFLMGLDNTKFGTLRTQIINITPLVSVNRAYAMVTQEATSHVVTHEKEKGGDILGYVVQGGGGVARSGKRSVCTHCKKVGHEVDTCYTLHGFPEGFGRGKGQGKGCGGKGRGFGSVTAAAALFGSSPTELGGGPSGSSEPGRIGGGESLAIPGVTSEMVQRLVQLLESAKVAEKLSGPHYEDADWDR